MNNRRVLITGANGMVGKNILEHPEINNFDVIAPNRSSLDLKNFAEVHKYIENNRPDFIIHCAGKVGGIQANINDPLGFFIENIDIGRNVVMAAKDVGISRLINIGSSCMYPKNHDGHLREEMILGGPLEETTEGYALAKIAIARLCQYIHQQDNRLHYKTLIPCNLYGRHDKFEKHQSHLIPAIIEKIHHAMKTNAPEVEIWGDGTARREFLYAGDFADALLKALSEFDRIPSLMNIGLGHYYSINEYHSTVANVMGYTGTFTHNLSQPVGMTRKLTSTERQKAWGWSAKNSLEQGIEKHLIFFFQRLSNEIQIPSRYSHLG